MCLLTRLVTRAPNRKLIFKNMKLYNEVKALELIEKMEFIKKSIIDSTIFKYSFFLLLRDFACGVCECVGAVRVGGARVAAVCVGVVRVGAVRVATVCVSAARVGGHIKLSSVSCRAAPTQRGAFIRNGGLALLRLKSNANY